MRTFPFGAFTSSIPNAVRRRKLGLSPIVTSASAPDFTNALRSIVRSPLSALELGRAERQSDDLCEPGELRSWTESPPLKLRASRIGVPGIPRVGAIRASRLSRLHHVAAGGKIRVDVQRLRPLEIGRRRL